MLQRNFLDPELTSDGKPYGPARYQQIVEERYLISKHLHTSYLDVGEISPVERKYLLGFIMKDLERERELRQQILNKK